MTVSEDFLAEKAPVLTEMVWHIDSLLWNEIPPGSWMLKNMAQKWELFWVHYSAGVTPCSIQCGQGIHVNMVTQESAHCNCCIDYYDNNISMDRWIDEVLALHDQALTALFIHGEVLKVMQYANQTLTNYWCSTYSQIQQSLCVSGKTYSDYGVKVLPLLLLLLESQWAGTQISSQWESTPRRFVADSLKAWLSGFNYKGVVQEEAWEASEK